jgi:hypothetical protein
MFQSKSYSKIVEGFKKTITECEQLILKNVNEDKKIAEELTTLEQRKTDAQQKRVELEIENRKAGALASKLMDLIEE